jgi:alpha-beta hydrolase superfamily lysophospholipase
MEMKVFAAALAIAAFVQAAPGFAVEKEPALRETPFRFVRGSADLHGTLVFPSGPGPYPAMILLHDAGAEPRSAKYELAKQFARAGVAALVYDQRGVGQSSADWRTATLDDFAQDADYAVRFFRGRPDIQAKHIGVYGHGQGAVVAPRVAAIAQDLAFAVISEPPAAFAGLKNVGAVCIYPGAIANVDEMVTWTSRAARGDPEPAKGLATACR